MERGSVDIPCSILVSLPIKLCQMLRAEPNGSINTPLLLPDWRRYDYNNSRFYQYKVSTVIASELNR